ncbi:MAG: hypothetical protein IKS83_00390, partial [Victivallales bacterium]|nr:hypothetical protein [Victivallales bacterium]
QNQNQNQNPPEEASKSGPASKGLGFLGFLLGIPLSYVFQPGIIRAKLTCGDYIMNLPKMISNIIKDPDKLGVQVLLTLVITCVVTSGIGRLIGKAIDK